MANTTRFGIARPADADLVSNGASAMRAIADGFDANMAGYSRGVFVSIPTAGTPGRFYLATDVLTDGPNGSLYFDDGTAWQLVTFGPSTWNTLSLSANLAAAAGFYAPAYRIDFGGVIRLRGAMRNTSASGLASGYTLATLPAGFRPAASVSMPCIIGPNVASLTTTGAGAMSLGFTFGAGLTTFLDGITFTTS